jgi:hypothetical protein
MVVIGLASAALPQPYLARMQALSQIPDLDVAAAVLGRLAQRGVALPAIVQATYLHDACTLGAGALVVGGFLRNPPTDVVRVT